MNRQEAIRIVKNNWPNDRLMLSEALEFLIPELQESKGDKIRKMIRGWIYTRPSSFFDNGVSKEETLAWLEKQGEEKTADNIEPKFHEGDTIRLKNSNAVYVIESISNGRYYGKGFSISIAGGNRNYELVERYYVDNIEQKPAEWSEEDERMLASFLHKVEVCDLLSNKESVWILKKLKSLKPQPHWKPTEEQLEDLLNACNRAYLTSGQLQSLIKLYLKLKSL